MTTLAPTIDSGTLVYNSGGNVLNDGGNAIIAKGVCWSTLPHPTDTLTTKTNDGSGTGAFNSLITGLTTGTTYYLRSYAVSSCCGTSYGNEISFTTSSTFPVIGQYYNGGIIAYILQSGDSGYSSSTPHGLIAAPYDQGIASLWGCYGTWTFLGTTYTAFGTGNANSNAIISACGTIDIGYGSAAFICKTLTLNGYSDWYLPSKDELLKISGNQFYVGGFQSGHFYMSSSEYDSHYCWEVEIGSNYATGNLKWGATGPFVFFRAVRSF